MLRSAPARLARMKGRLVAAPGAFLIAVAAALWGTDALLRRPLAQSTEAATIVFGEHLVLVLLTLPLIPAALAAVFRAGPRYVAAAAAIGIGASAIALAGSPNAKRSVVTCWNRSLVARSRPRTVPIAQRTAAPIAISAGSALPTWMSNGDGNAISQVPTRPASRNHP